MDCCNLNIVSHRCLSAKLPSFLLPLLPADLPLFCTVRLVTFSHFSSRGISVTGGSDTQLLWGMVSYSELSMTPDDI